MKLFKNKLFLIVEASCLILIPLILAYFYPQIMLYRTIIMAISLIYIFVVTSRLNISIKSMGLVNNYFPLKEIVVPSVMFSLIFYLVNRNLLHIVVFPEVLNEFANIPLLSGIAVYVLIVVPLQDFIFFGFYIARLEFVSRNPVFLTLYSSVIFMLIHSPYRTVHPLLLIGTFALGLWLSNNFLKYRNLYALMLSHALLGCSIIASQFM